MAANMVHGSAGYAAGFSAPTMAVIQKDLNLKDSTIKWFGNKSILLLHISMYCSIHAPALNWLCKFTPTVLWIFDELIIGANTQGEQKVIRYISMKDLQLLVLFRSPHMQCAYYKLLKNANEI